MASPIRYILIFVWRRKHFQIHVYDAKHKKMDNVQDIKTPGLHCQEHSEMNLDIFTFIRRSFLLRVTFIHVQYTLS
jgi:hypothetical protein